MKSRKTVKRQSRSRRVGYDDKEQAEASARKPRDLSLDTLSTHALIEALRGSCKGTDSLVAIRERDHKRDDRARSRKLGQGR
ncbi:MAG: hypothetical protein WCB94_12300 [Terriglobales bacterium]